ncbi:MAG TPA: sensor histidine kinase [Acidimicrobiales bacterium]|nr:sensor histidine kinase [Acidimicrobiales bacterium]
MVTNRSAPTQHSWGNWGTDAAIALVTAAIDYYGAYDEAHNPVQGDPSLKLPTVPPWAYVLVVAAGLVLVGRRRWPVATYVAVLALTLAYTVLGYDDGAPLLAVAVGLYALATATNARTTWTCLAASVVLLGVAFAAFEPFGVTQGPLTVVPFEALAGAGAGFAVANRRTTLAQARDRVEQAERSREEVARRRVEAERLRIARELHDVVAHTMATINVQAGAASHLLRERPEEVAKALEAMEQVRTTSKEALRELRGILDLLRFPEDKDSVAPVAGLAQLDDLVVVTTKAGLPITVERHGTPRPLAAAADLASYRVVQEALTNTLRHAGPARALVKLVYAVDGLTIEVTDDGRGPVSNEAGGREEGARGGREERASEEGASEEGGRQEGGSGLRGMRERVEAAGGRVAAAPGPRGGFVVKATLPYAPVALPGKVPSEATSAR